MVVVATSAVAVVAPPVARAADPLPLGHPCSQTTDDAGRSGRTCPGTATTYDGVELDEEVSLPLEDDGPFPLVVVLPGLGARWSDDGPGFAWTDRGYAVLNYTVRGMFGSCGTQGARDESPAACASGWLHFAGNAFEVRDTQYLAGVLADEGIAEATRIGVLGYSYGGAQALTLATLRDREVAPDGEIEPWVSPAGTPMRIAAAAPVAGWSDIAYALVPNGRWLDGTRPEQARDLAPVGVLKDRFLDQIYATGQAFGYYAPAGADPGADLPGWRDRLNQGEPYDGDPAAEEAVRELALHHSALFVPRPDAPAPTLMLQGFSDDLFPPSQALRYYERVRSEHQDAVISLLLLDAGHGRAANRGSGEIDRARAAWFDHFVKGDGPRPFDGVEAWVGTCPVSAPLLGPIRVASWEAIHPGEVTDASSGSQQVRSAVADSPADDAAAPEPGNECATAPAGDAPGAANYRFPPAPPGGYTLLGSPAVAADMRVHGDEPEIVARLWDVAPGGHTEMLVARGLYRPRASGRQTLQLEAGAWRFAAGHMPKLELVGRDPPFARPSNGSFQIDISQARLRLPVREPPGAAEGVVRTPGAPIDSWTGAAPLRVDIAYAPAGPGRARKCAWSSATATLGGGLARVAAVDFVRDGVRVAHDPVAPFARRLRPGFGRRLRVQVTRDDGAEFTLARRLRRCGS
jgi:predicted acyl esterase